jgi:uncharacterized RDD family membrane protein YckC
MVRKQGSPTQVLSMGNIVSIALQLCRVKGGNYFLTSLLANLWLTLTMIGVFVAIAIASVFVVIGISTTPNPSPANFLPVVIGILLLVSPVLLFALARFTASGGLLSRQMFRVLQQQEEAIAEARQAVFPRVWVFARSLLWSALVITASYLGLGAIAYLVYLGVATLLVLVRPIDVSPQTSFTVGVVVVIGILLLGLLFLLALSWVAARLALVDVVVALETQVTGIGAIGRSWRLTQGAAWRTLTVLFIGSVVTTPAALLSSILNTISVIPVVGLVFGVAVFPFWQSIKAVLYYDLRSRKEGINFDLEAPTTLPARFLKRVCLQTPESVELDFALAGIGSRAYGWLIDQILIYLGLSLLTLGGAYVYIYVVYPWLQEAFPDAVSRVGQWSIALYLLLTFVIYNGYYIIFETIWQGQTPGKRIAQIRVVQDNGQPIGIKEASLRSLIQTVDFGLFFIGSFLVTFSRSEKRLGDMAAGTLVIQDEQARRKAAPNLQDQIGQASQQAAQTLLQSDNLRTISPDQYLTIREFLQQREQLSPPARVRSASKLAGQVKEMMPNAPPLDIRLTDEEFLEAVYLAYRRTRQSASDPESNL